MTADPSYFLFSSSRNNYVEKTADFLAALLNKGVVEAVAVPCWSAGRPPSYMIVANPLELANADPFAPVMLRNAADLLAEFTRQGLPRPVAVVVRSCEMRALIELVKLKQAHLENILLIGADCLGTVPIKKLKECGTSFTLKVMANPLPVDELRHACRLCGLRAPMGGDIVLCALGVDINNDPVVLGRTEKGKEVLAGLGLKEGQKPEKRDEKLARLEKEATELLADTSAIDLLSLLNRCMRCYNCRDMCPICYCPECFFTSAKLGYNSTRYLEWAKRKGSLSLPTDVLLFHITRMNHMLTSCVGCGICEAACPNDIPLGRIYGVLRKQVQQLFDYEAGRSLDEPLPMAVFTENELHQVEE